MVLNKIRNHPRLRLLKRRIRNRFNGYRATNPPATNWGDLLEREGRVWDAARARAVGGRKVLIATSTGGHGAITPIESALAVALTLRGAEVHFLLCDAALPACLQLSGSDPVDHELFLKAGVHPVACATCAPVGFATYKPLNLTIQRYTQLLTREDRARAAEIARTLPLDDIASYQLDDLSVGEHALAGALRYFARGDISVEPDGEIVLRRYLQAALITAFVTQRLLEREGYEVLCFHHGIYVPQGIVGEVARKRGVRVVNWNPSYRKQTVIFSHGDTYHHTLMEEPTAAWDQLDWTPELEQMTLDYLKSRWEGTQDWIWFHEKPQMNLEHISAELDLDLNKPIIGMLTNVIWDAQLHYPANAFPNMIEWIHATIRYFCARPDLQLVLRVHPAEIRGAIPSRQRVVDEIQRAFPTLPPHIKVIPPESDISTYAVMSVCNSVLIYGTKTGVELTSVGIPVIVAGEAWIRNKGLTIDLHSAADYFSILDQLPLPARLDESTITRARKYAFHFFFRRMIPLTFAQPQSGWPPLRVNITTLDQLRVGADKGLDVICSGILNGTEFIYLAEETI